MSNSCNPMSSLTGSSVHGILQARILEWVAIPFSRGSSRPSDRTWVSCTAGRRFTIIAVLALCQTSTQAASLNPHRNPVWRNGLRIGKLRPGLVQELDPILESCAVRPPQPLLNRSWMYTTREPHNPNSHQTNPRFLLFRHSVVSDSLQPHEL